MEKVSVNKGFLVGVVAIAGGALLAVAFLLGRASGTGSAVRPEPALPEGSASPAADPRGTGQQAGAPAPGATPIADPVELWPAPGLPSSSDGGAAPSALPGPAAGDPAPGGSDPARAAVAAYFEAIDRIHPGEMGGDAEGVANEMAVALAKGDSTGLDKLIRETEEAKARLSALVPPPPCAVHHRESLASTDDALEMLRSVKSAMESPDAVSQLSAVASRAAALRSRAEALQKEEKALRERFGLTG